MDNLIKQFEGLRLKAYRDAIGIPTIGYGTTKYPDGRQVSLNDVITKEEAERYLLHEIKRIHLRLQQKYPTWGMLNENQKEALTSFAYNLGLNLYIYPTIHEFILDPRQWYNKHKVHYVFGLYVKAGGKTLQGLVRRRKAEADLFLTPIKDSK